MKMRIATQKCAFAPDRPPRRTSDVSRNYTLRCNAISGHGDDGNSLVSLPAFTGSSVLFPCGKGMLRAFEPRYTTMFQRLIEESSDGTGRGARFCHILGSSAAPPAMLEDATGGLPTVGCAAVIDSIQRDDNGSLIVSYTGDRRLKLRFVETSASFDDTSAGTSDSSYLQVVGHWYDDADPETLAIGMEYGQASATLDGLERDVFAMIKLVQKLSRQVDPDNSALPEAIFRYAPPSSRQTSSRPTSYDALKAAGHRAATAIDMWRAHGSVYKQSNSGSRQIHADPYTQFSEQLGKARRQELFSFAVASLLQMNTPESAALLLSRDTTGRLTWVLEAVKPFLAELQAAAAVKNALKDTN